MFVVGNFIHAVVVVLGFVLDALALIILVNALLSWVRPDPSNPIVQFLDRVSDAMCNPIRRLFPTVVGGLDLAPLVALLAIQFLKLFLLPTLERLATGLM